MHHTKRAMHHTVLIRLKMLRWLFSIIIEHLIRLKSMDTISGGCSGAVHVGDCAVEQLRPIRAEVPSIVWLSCEEIPGVDSVASTVADTLHLLVNADELEKTALGLEAANFTNIDVCSKLIVERPVVGRRIR